MVKYVNSNQDSWTWLLLVTDHKWVHLSLSCSFMYAGDRCMYVRVCVCVCVSGSRQSLSYRMRARSVIFLVGGVHIVCVIPICVSDGTGCAVP